MGMYRTALGKPVDMSALAAKNEKVRAVGNMNVNSRGDTIDANGKVIVPATSKVNKAYTQTIGNRSAQHVKNQRQAKPVANHAPVKNEVMEELTDIEKELEQSLNDELEIEQIKASEMGKY